MPFFFSFLKRRKALVVGATLFVFLLYTLSSFVWTVDVTGNRTIKTADILKVAEAGGLGKGVLKWYLSVEKVEEHILNELSAVSWVGIHIDGTHAAIEIVEKKLPPRELTGPSNIVATKAGLVKEVLVLSGQPAVNEGDTVVEGQVLISGEMLPPEDAEITVEETTDENEIVEAESVYVRARGIVRARVWYEGYGEEELVKSGFRATGKTTERICITLGDKDIILKGPEKITYEKYESEATVKTLPHWRNLSLPVEFSTETYKELAPFTEKKSMKSAKELAAQTALENAKKAVPHKALVLNKRMEDVIVGHKENIVRVRVVIETLEDIGLEKPFSPPKEEKVNIDR